MTEGNGRTAGDLAVALVTVVGLNKLVILLLRPVGVLIGRQEQQLLELVEQVPPGIRADLAGYDTRLQVTDECGRRSGYWRQLGPISALGAARTMRMMLPTGVGVANSDGLGGG